MKLVWTPDAISSLRAVRGYIDRENSVAAEKVANEIEHAVANLEAFPRSGRLGLVPGTRELIIAGLPYLVIYRVTDAAIEILWVAHTSQQRQ